MIYGGNSGSMRLGVRCSDTGSKIPPGCTPAPRRIPMTPTARSERSSDKSAPRRGRPLRGVLWNRVTVFLLVNFSSVLLICLFRILSASQPNEYAY